MDTLISLLVFASVALLAAVLLLLLFSEERQVTRALRTITEWESNQISVAEPQLQPFRTRVMGPSLASAASIIRRLVPANARAATQHRLELAGEPGGLTPEGVTALRLVVGLVCLSVAAVGFAISRSGVTSISILMTAGAAALGALAPGIWLSQVIAQRKARIQLALPDMLDMLTISVQAGLGFDMALGKLVRNTSGPLAREFARMLREVQAGVSRRDAFRHMGERTEVPELDAFIVAMVQADVFGVSISGILRSQASELRKKRRARAEEKAQKAPVQMVFPTILCILPATMLVILGPAVISIGRTFGMIK